MKSHKKRIYLLFSIIVFASFFILIFLYTKKDQLAFKHYVKQFTTEQLSASALDLHYTLKDPKAYGIECDTLLSIYQSGDALTSFHNLENELEKLSKIDVTCLSDEDAFTYNVLYDYLSENIELEKYPYYQEPLTPNSGIHTTLPILLAEYRFYSEEDVAEYLELLSAIPDYLDSIALYEEEKAIAGLFMNSEALEQVILACTEFATYDDLSEHLLHCSFEERLDELSFNISKEDYIIQNDTILLEEVFPAYLSLADKLTFLSSYCNDNYHGLCTYEFGKEYYQALLKRNTGSYRSIPDIKEMLFSSFEDSYLNLVSLLTTYPWILETDCLYEFNDAFPLKDADVILNNLQETMVEDFPPLLADTDVEVKTVSESLEDYCSPAFYLTVPLDDYKNNVIYLNEKNSLKGLDLYTTLAHEGFPGHLYQTVYFHSANDTSVNNYSTLLRNLLYFGGYTEGYALYVESLSYEYAKNVFSDSGNIDDANVTTIEDSKIICDTLMYEWKMQISLYCLLDIAIHYDGATYEQVKALLNKFGILDEDSTKAVYQYLLSEPTTYMQYYLGYLEIENLKQISKGVWDTDYSDTKFHTFLLETGPCNFKRLENKLLQYE